MLKLAFWGLGSIAKRHIRNTREILDERGIEAQIHVYRHKISDIQENEIAEIVTEQYQYDEISDHQYDIIFITNPTSFHLDGIKKCKNHTKHMFIEKPILDDPNTNIKDFNLNDAHIYYVACPLRYTAALQYIKNNVNMDNVIAARAISSSYLPEWRPGQDYRNTYSAHKDLGGGVAIDLIHEWDYLTSFFGFPNDVYYLGGKNSNLEIDSDDFAIYIAKYPRMSVELHLDYYGRSTIRTLDLFTEEDTITADLVNSTVKYHKSGKLIEFNEARDVFQKREINHFLDMVFGTCTNDSSIEHAINVLRLTKGELEDA